MSTGGLPRGESPLRRPRIALYSHDSQGLGHLRRNLSIAAALATAPDGPDVLLVAGAAEARAFPLPPRTDLVTLPGLSKDVDGTYRPRSLAVGLDELVAIRSAAAGSALTAFDPDLLIVDKVARGALGELTAALDALRARGRARMVLGLRDVLDDAPTASAEWWRDGTTDAVERYYDAVWVYGDPRVFDPVREYRLPPSVTDKLRYTGYIGAGPRPGGRRPGTPYVLCTVGGGQDGAAVAETFLEADLPPGVDGVVLTGPFMAASMRADLERLGRRRDRRVLRFVEDPVPLLAQARGVVAMGGYNTTVELLRQRTPALLVPRVAPRREQLVRAQRLAALGLVDMLHPADLTPARLTEWLRPPRQRRRGPAPVALNGHRTVRALVAQLLEGPGGERVAV